MCQTHTRVCEQAIHATESCDGFTGCGFKEFSYLFAVTCNLEAAATTTMA